MLYGARTPDDFCYRDETAAWKDAGVELRQVISQPDGTIGPTGYEKAQKHLAHKPSYDCFF